jgi:phosphate acetyltransferase
MLAAGHVEELMKEIIGLHHQFAPKVEIIVVEGLVPGQTSPYTSQLNAHMAKALDAEIIVVSTPATASPDKFEDQIKILAGLYGGRSATALLGCILNQLDPTMVSAVKRESSVFDEETFRLLGAIPLLPDLLTPRTMDIGRFLGAKILNIGEIARRRVGHVALCARTIPNMVHVLKAGTLVVTPADRGDVILATAMSALNGVPLAGLLLTGDFEPDSRILEFCGKALETGLPVLSVPLDSYETATQIGTMTTSVPIDDEERLEKVMNAIANHIDASWLKARCETKRQPQLSPAAFRYQLTQKSRQVKMRIVLPEGNEPRTIQAAVLCQQQGIAHCVLLGNANDIASVAGAHDSQLPSDLEIMDPVDIRDRYVQALVELRKHKGITTVLAGEMLEDHVVLGSMMLALGDVDGLVSGAVHTTANIIQPAFQLIRTAPGVNRVSSVFFMCLPDQVLVYGDCAVNPDPNAEELAEIAIQSADTAAAFGICPRVAMISYSTGDSGAHQDVEKVREATNLVRAKRPDLLIDGPLQYDTAAVEAVGRQKAPHSQVAGKATVFIFPDLNTGNTTYKAVQRSANVVSIGPILQGLRRPVNDLSRGALVDDIVYTIAVTAIQAQGVRE